MEKTVPQEVLIRIREKYGQHNLKLFANFYGANLPEHTWLKDYNGKLDDKKLKTSVIKEQNVSCFVTKSKIQNQIISDTLKECIKLGRACYRIDFFRLMSLAVDSMNKFNLNKIQNEFWDMEVIAITGIKFGEIYDRYKDYFVIIYDNFMNDNIKKTIILGLENTKDRETAYGELMDYVNDEIVIE